MRASQPRPVSFHNQPVPDYTIYEATEAAKRILGDLWGVEPGPWATTGHLRAWDATPFTVGVTDGTGQLYVRNDQLGDAAPLAVTAAAPITTTARAIADAIDSLY